jgi:hypothetical protein
MKVAHIIISKMKSLMKVSLFKLNQVPKILNGSLRLMYGSESSRLVYT